MSIFGYTQCGSFETSIFCQINKGQEISLNNYQTAKTITICLFEQKPDLLFRFKSLFNWGLSNYLTLKSSKYILHGFNLKKFLAFFCSSLLASASRDRLIHVFDTCREYGFVHTLDDHSSSITAIRFLKMPPRPGVENSVQIASCGADKSIIFRDISSDHKGGLEFTRGNHIVGKTTLYDMETDVSKPTPGILFFLCFKVIKVQEFPGF